MVTVGAEAEFDPAAAMVQSCALEDAVPQVVVVVPEFKKSTEDSWHFQCSQNIPAIFTSTHTPTPAKAAVTSTNHLALCGGLYTALPVVVRRSVSLSLLFIFIWLSAIAVE